MICVTRMDPCYQSYPSAGLARWRSHLKKIWLLEMTRLFNRALCWVAGTWHVLGILPMQTLLIVLKICCLQRDKTTNNSHYQENKIVSWFIQPTKYGKQSEKKLDAIKIVVLPRISTARPGRAGPLEPREIRVSVYSLVTRISISVYSIVITRKRYSRDSLVNVYLFWLVLRM